MRIGNYYSLTGRDNVTASFTTLIVISISTDKEVVAITILDGNIILNKVN